MITYACSRSCRSGLFFLSCRDMTRTHRTQRRWQLSGLLLSGLRPCACSPCLAAVEPGARGPGWVDTESGGCSTLSCPVLPRLAALAMRLSISASCDTLLVMVGRRELERSATSDTSSSMLTDGDAATPCPITSVCMMLILRPNSLQAR